MTNICICGGGALGHVCAGMIASRHQANVNVLTQHPEQWHQAITVHDCHGQTFIGPLNLVTNNAQQAVANCNIVFLCLPGFAIEETLQAIKPYLHKNAVVGSVVCSTGFFFAAHRILPQGAKLFGFQRTPFIARTTSYGASANLLGYKPQIAMAAEHIEDPESFRLLVEKIWMTPTKLLHNFYEASLTNSNPILHTGRLYSLWKDWHGQTHDHEIRFYEEWTDEASQTIIDMDQEFQQLLTHLPVSTGAIPALLDYYECHDASSLTQKIKSIPAFKGIAAPMKKNELGWMPDLGSRYFTEDFPFGLRFIVQLARQHNVYVPLMESVYSWGIKLITS